MKISYNLYINVIGDPDADISSNFIMLEFQNVKVRGGEVFLGGNVNYTITTDKNSPKINILNNVSVFSKPLEGAFLETRNLCCFVTGSLLY